jgi:hypothetical protein
MGQHPITKLFAVGCTAADCTCPARTGYYLTQEEAAKAWNTRADLPRATAGDIEEREAAVCPEDVGFEEYIRVLQNALRPFAAVRREGSDPNEAVLVRGSDWVLNRDLERAAKLTAATPRATADTGDGWLPIETAPKTGERVLLGHGNSVWEDEWWNGNEANWTECVNQPNGFRGTHAGEVASHWQPLPPPPKPKERMSKRNGNVE